MRCTQKNMHWKKRLPFTTFFWSARAAFIGKLLLRERTLLERSQYIFADYPGFLVRLHLSFARPFVIKIHLNKIHLNKNFSFFSHGMDFRLNVFPWTTNAQLMWLPTSCGPMTTKMMPTTPSQQQRRIGSSLSPNIETPPENTTSNAIWMQENTELWSVSIYHKFIISSWIKN